MSTGGELRRGEDGGCGKHMTDGGHRKNMRDAVKAKLEDGEETGCGLIGTLPTLRRGYTFSHIKVFSRKKEKPRRRKKKKNPH